MKSQKKTSIIKKPHGNTLATQNQIAYTILIMRIIVIRDAISTNQKSLVSSERERVGIRKSYLIAKKYGS